MRDTLFYCVLIVFGSVIVINSFFVSGIPLESDITCSDTDGGLNYNVMGKAVDYQGKIYQDYCIRDIDEKVNASTEVLEYSCQTSPGAEGQVGSSRYTCSNGCKDGACVTPPSSACSDTDGGINYALKGTVSNPSGLSNTDFCGPVTSNQPNVVHEYFCSGSTPNVTVYDCPSGVCKDGACQSQACGAPVCEGVYNTGEIDEEGCPVYACPSRACSKPACEGAYDTRKIDFRGCPVYACPSGKCEEYPTNQCPVWCVQKTLCTKCIEDQPCPEASCQLVCASPSVDMNSCLDKPTNYWDQETNSCYAGFSSDMIKYSCSDPDGGRNYYQYAHTYGFRSSYADERDKRIRTGGSDSCFKEGQLLEHYCDEKGFIQTEYFQCPNGCDKEGSCVKGEVVSEKITCKFEDTKKEQQCYLAGQWSSEDEGTKFCKADAGSGSCVITYSGYTGEKVTWKSTCGQYQYTTQDGNDEVIYFKCSEGEKNATEIKNIGFRFAYWQCYDGNEQKSEDKTSCKLSETWQKYAKDYCNNKCKGEKCGVNSFSVSQECYNDEILSTEVFSETGIFIKPTEPVLDSESILICKDSCPSDNKCYPFGYRKDGNYCSDESKFIEQLKADNSCENNFECSSNVCISSKCIEENLLKKILSWFKKLFGTE